MIANHAQMPLLIATGPFLILADEDGVDKTIVCNANKLLKSNK